MDTYFISHSHAYRLKHKVEAFLREIDLTLDNNRITGKEYRVRYLIALLQAEYGVLIYPLLDEEKQMIDDFMATLNLRINIDTLAHNAEGHAYFRSLISMVFKRIFRLVQLYWMNSVKNILSLQAFLLWFGKVVRKHLKKSLVRNFHIMITCI